MKNYKAATFLSFLCPGLGQIYKREVLKGISFMMICALLVIALFFLSPPPPFLRFFGLSILAIIWLVGIFDAWVSDEFLMERERQLVWKKMLSIMHLAVVSIAIIALIMLWSHDLSAMNESMVANAKIKTSPDIQDMAGSAHSTDTGTQTGSQEYYSVQVASFKESERAEKVYWSLWFKKYAVAIEKSESEGESWHRVLVGKFSTEREAEALIKTLQEREGFANMIVRRRSAEKSE